MIYDEEFDYPHSQYLRYGTRYGTHGSIIDAPKSLEKTRYFYLQDLPLEPRKAKSYLLKHMQANGDIHTSIINEDIERLPRGRSISIDECTKFCPCKNTRYGAQWTAAHSLITGKGLLFLQEAEDHNSPQTPHEIIDLCTCEKVVADDGQSDAIKLQLPMDQQIRIVTSNVDERDIWIEKLRQEAEEAKRAKAVVLAHPGFKLVLDLLNISDPEESEHSSEDYESSIEDTSEPEMLQASYRANEALDDEMKNIETPFAITESLEQPNLSLRSIDAGIRGQLESLNTEKLLLILRQALEQCYKAPNISNGAVRDAQMEAKRAASKARQSEKEQESHTEQQDLETLFDDSKKMAALKTRMSTVAAAKASQQKHEPISDEQNIRKPPFDERRAAKPAPDEQRKKSLKDQKQLQQKSKSSPKQRSDKHLPQQQKSSHLPQQQKPKLSSQEPKPSLGQKQDQVPSKPRYAVTLEEVDEDDENVLTAVKDLFEPVEGQTNMADKHRGDRIDKSVSEKDDKQRDRDHITEDVNFNEDKEQLHDFSRHAEKAKVKKLTSHLGKSLEQTLRVDTGNASDNVRRGQDDEINDHQFESDRGIQKLPGQWAIDPDVSGDQPSTRIEKLRAKNRSGKSASSKHRPDIPSKDSTSAAPSATKSAIPGAFESAKSRENDSPMAKSKLSAMAKPSALEMTTAEGQDVDDIKIQGMDKDEALEKIRGDTGMQNVGLDELAMKQIGEHSAVNETEDSVRADGVSYADIVAGRDKEAQNAANELSELPGVAAIGDLDTDSESFNDQDIANVPITSRTNTVSSGKGDDAAAEAGALGLKRPDLKPVLERSSAFNRAKLDETSGFGDWIEQRQQRLGLEDEDAIEQKVPREPTVGAEDKQSAFETSPAQARSHTALRQRKLSIESESSAELDAAASEIRDQVMDMDAEATIPAGYEDSGVQDVPLEVDVEDKVEEAIDQHQPVEDKLDPQVEQALRDLKEQAISKIMREERGTSDADNELSTDDGESNKPLRRDSLISGSSGAGIRQKRVDKSTENKRDLIKDDNIYRILEEPSEESDDLQSRQSRQSQKDDELAADGTMDMSFAAPESSEIAGKSLFSLDQDRSKSEKGDGKMPSSKSKSDQRKSAGIEKLKSVDKCKSFNSQSDVGRESLDIDRHEDKKDDKQMPGHRKDKSAPHKELATKPESKDKQDKDVLDEYSKNARKSEQKPLEDVLSDKVELAKAQTVGRSVKRPSSTEEVGNERDRKPDSEDPENLARDIRSGAENKPSNASRIDSKPEVNRADLARDESEANVFNQEARDKDHTSGTRDPSLERSKNMEAASSSGFSEKSDKEKKNVFAKLFGAQSEAEKQAKEETDEWIEQTARELAEKVANDKIEEKAQIQAEKQAKLQAEIQAEKQAKELAEKKAKEHAERLAEEQAKMKAEKEAKERAEKEAKELADKKAKIQAEIQADKKAKKQAEKKAIKQAEKLAIEQSKEQAEKHAKEEAEKEANELADKQSQIQAEIQTEKQAKEEAENKSREQAEKVAEAQAKTHAEEEARKRAEEEAKEIAKKQARIQEDIMAEIEAKERAGNKAKKEAEKVAKELAKKQAEIEAKEQAEKDAKQQAEKDAKILAELQAEIEAKEQAQKKAIGQAEKVAEELTKKQAEIETKREAEMEAKKQAKELAKEHAKQEAEKSAKEQAENEAKIESERVAKIQAEAQAEKEAKEQEKQAKEEAEKQAEIKEKEQAEKQAKEEAEEKAKQQAEIEAEKKEREQAEKQAEIEAKSKEQAEKKAQEQAKEQAEEQARAQAEKEAEEKANRQEKEQAKQQAEKKPAQQAEKQAKKQADKEAKQQAKEQAKIQAKEQAEKKSKEQAEKKAKKQAEKQAKRQAKKQAKIEAKEQAEKRPEKDAEHQAVKQAKEETKKQDKEVEKELTDKLPVKPSDELTNKQGGKELSDKQAGKSAETPSGKLSNKKSVDELSKKPADTTEERTGADTSTAAEDEAVRDTESDKADILRRSTRNEDSEAADIDWLGDELTLKVVNIPSEAHTLDIDATNFVHDTKKKMSDTASRVVGSMMKLQKITGRHSDKSEAAEDNEERVGTGPIVGESFDRISLEPSSAYTLQELEDLIGTFQDKLTNFEQNVHETIKEQKKMLKEYSKDVSRTAARHAPAVEVSDRKNNLPARNQPTTGHDHETAVDTSVKIGSSSAETAQKPEVVLPGSSTEGVPTMSVTGDIANLDGVIEDLAEQATSNRIHSASQQVGQTELDTELKKILKNLRTMCMWLEGMQNKPKLQTAAKRSLASMRRSFSGSSRKISSLSEINRAERNFEDLMKQSKQQNLQQASQAPEGPQNIDRELNHQNVFSQTSHFSPKFRPKPDLPSSAEQRDDLSSPRERSKNASTDRLSRALSPSKWRSPSPTKYARSSSPSEMHRPRSMADIRKELKSEDINRSPEASQQADGAATQERRQSYSRPISRADEGPGLDSTATILLAESIGILNDLEQDIQMSNQRPILQHADESEWLENDISQISSRESSHSDNDEGGANESLHMHHIERSMLPKELREAVADARETADYSRSSHGTNPEQNISRDAPETRGSKQSSTAETFSNINNNEHRQREDGRTGRQDENASDSGSDSARSELSNGPELLEAANQSANDPVVLASQDDELAADRLLKIRELHQQQHQRQHPQSRSSVHPTIIDPSDKQLRGQPVADVLRRNIDETGVGREQHFLESELFPSVAEFIAQEAPLAPPSSLNLTPEQDNGRVRSFNLAQQQAQQQRSSPLQRPLYHSRLHSNSSLSSNSITR